MNNKRRKYVNRIIILDRIDWDYDITLWDKEDISDILDELYKEYGLKLINFKEEVFIKIEYSNIIWQYKFYYGSCKRKYHNLTTNDERWPVIEKYIESDLKMIGLENLKDNILLLHKNNENYEYRIEKEEQFKRYCI